MPKYLNHYAEINEDNEQVVPVHVDGNTTTCFFGFRGGHAKGDRDKWDTCLHKVQTGVTVDALKETCKHHDISFSDLPKENLTIYADDYSVHIDRARRMYFGLSYHQFCHIDIYSFLSNFKNVYISNLKKKVHEKVYPMPIGTYPDNDVDESINPNAEKTGFVVANFGFTTNLRSDIANWAIESRYIDDHFASPPEEFENQPEAIKRRFENKHVEYLSKQDYCKQLSEYRFCIAPEGNASDTFRQWEAISSNTVPIIQANYGNLIFSKIWPMITSYNYEEESLPWEISKFMHERPNFTYSEDLRSLLYQENLEHLLERIKYECSGS
jgi:hypothetical protein